MKIKRFADIVLESKYGDTSTVGLSDSDGDRLLHTGTNRRKQYFYDYYTGKRINGKSKYELNTLVFELAKRTDEIGLLAQYCMQIERESMSSDFDLEDRVNRLKK